MIAGEKKVCIFGFCDIHSFAQVTEVLEEEIMMFVNGVAELVHKQVDRF